MSSVATEDAVARLAVLDVGTNSIRLVVAESLSDGTYRVLDEERDMVRLGRGLARTGKLGEEPMERALEAIGKMKAIADGFQVDEIRVVATSAVREAANGPEFCREARRRHGVPIEVISSEEEARLAFRSVLRHFDLDGRPIAVVDIGGGSVEVVLAAGAAIDQVHWLPLGAVRVTERYCRSDPVRPKQSRRLTKAIDRIIRQRIGKPPFAAQTMIGSGGTFTTLAEMIQCEREGQAGTVQGYHTTRAEVVRLLERLLETPLEARRHMPGLNPARADIIVAGTAVIARLAKWLGTQQILINDRGIRDGLLLSMIAELPGMREAAPQGQLRDRLEWVRLFARKCRSNERHCEHVARLAGQILDGLTRTWELPPEAPEILQAATLLHDIGYLINHSKHHKHAYHLILHSDLPGFSAREIELIANVARYHRRAFPKRSHANLKRLSRADRRLVPYLSAILRIADGLDRTHTQCIRNVRCEENKGSVRLMLEADVNPQVEVWDAERKAGLFHKVFGIRIEFVWSQDARKPVLRPLWPARRIIEQS